jgi:tetratricopeptide (TPR) repeat protein
MPEVGQMGSRYLQQFALLATLNVALPMSPAARAQDADPNNTATSASTTVVGPRNQPLYDGAQEIQSGNIEGGIRLTLEGLSLAQDRREEEAALTNLCTAYLRLRQFDAALKYCDMLIERNENAWRGYNSRAMIYLEQQQYEKADQDLKRAEAINPNAATLKAARAMYMDAVHPVAPAVEIDDAKPGRSTQ